MDVLFVVGRGSKHDNVELRWALRSLEMHASGLGSVAVVGYPPPWLDFRSVRLLSVPDLKDSGGKHVNIMNCILTAIDEGAVSGEFLYSSDDHFLVRNVNLDSYPYWFVSDHIFTAKERAESGRRVNNWSLSCSDTRELLEKSGLPFVRFDCHKDTHMHTSDAPKVRELVERGVELGYTRGFEPTDLFMNVRIARQPLSLTKVKDRKFSSFTSVAEFSDRLGTSDTFSISDGMLEGPEFGTLMNLMYRSKSRFEL